MTKYDENKKLGELPKSCTRILGVKIDLLSRREVLNRVVNYLDRHDNNTSEEAEPCLLSTTNPEFIMTAQRDEEFKEIINRSFLSVPDGVGVLYANYYLNHLKGNLISELKRLIFGGSSDNAGGEKILGEDVFGERITGVELVYDLCTLAGEKGYNVFLLGGWPTNYFGRPLKNPGYDLAERAGEKLKNRYPGLRIVGATSRFSHDLSDDKRTVDFIRSEMTKFGTESVDILIVCYGHKNQEKWIVRNAKKIPAKICIGAGGTFDYVTGDKSWAPLWLRRMHLEWFYRLVTQPWRIKRIFISFPLFPLKVFFNSL